MLGSNDKYVYFVLKSQKRLRYDQAIRCLITGASNDYIKCTIYKKEKKKIMFLKVSRYYENTPIQIY